MFKKWLWLIFVESRIKINNGRKTFIIRIKYDLETKVEWKHFYLCEMQRRSLSRDRKFVRDNDVKWKGGVFR